jgi:hypothetical protein
LNEVKDPDFREQIENAWAFLSEPVIETVEQPDPTRLDMMAQQISSSKQGKEDLQALLALAGTAICAMNESDRNHALFSFHDDAIRSAIMLIWKINQDKLSGHPIAD